MRPWLILFCLYTILILNQASASVKFDILDYFAFTTRNSTVYIYEKKPGEFKEIVTAIGNGTELKMTTRFYKSEKALKRNRSVTYQLENDGISIIRFQESCCKMVAKNGLYFDKIAYIGKIYKSSQKLTCEKNRSVKRKKHKALEVHRQLRFTYNINGNKTEKLEKQLDYYLNNVGFIKRKIESNKHQSELNLVKAIPIEPKD